MSNLKNSGEINLEFINLKDVNCCNKNEMTKVYKTACDCLNFCKNRYCDNLPNEETRVKLSEDIFGCDFINANMVDYDDNFNINEKRFILTQAPLPNTFEDFWKMIWEYDVFVIVMLTKFIEKDRIKADKYWTDLEDGESYGNIKVTVENIKEENGFKIRKMKLTSKNDSKVETKYTYHIHYENWPDFGVPQDVDSIKNLINKVELLRRSSPKNNHVVYHCSAGLGRAGTICAIHLGKLMQSNNLDVDIKSLVQKIRQQRSHCVQTVDQYKLIYRALDMKHMAN